MKERFYTSPSSIGSYFGVGFNSPEEQIKIDLGLEVAVFDEDAEDRMRLGKVLETPTLDYFEETLKIIITDRNDKDYWGYDNKIKGRVDGTTIFNGLDTVVECKISNSQSYKFTENLGYLFQVQTYMLMTDTTQAILCGLYQGKPIYKLIYRDEEMINDIKEMTDFIVNVLSGIEDFETYPAHLLEKYSKIKILPKIDELPEARITDIHTLLVLKEQIKDLEKQAKEIEERIKEEFDEGIFENDLVKLTLRENYRAGGVDIDKLALDYPEIVMENYRKPDTSYKTLRLTTKKAPK